MIGNENESEPYRKITALQERIAELEAALREHKRSAEETLREEADRFRLLSDYAYDWEYWVDPSGSYVYISPSCERITGYGPQEFVSNPDLLFEIIKPEYAEKISSHYENEKNKKESVFSLEFPIITRKGEERWLAHNCYPVYDKQGNYAGRRGNNRDITDRKQAEEKLQESEETYRNLFQNAQVGLFRTRIEDGKMLESNEQLAKMFGYERREEIISEYITSDNYVDPGTREKMLEEIKEKGCIKNYEARFYRKDGSIFWASYSARIYPDRGLIEGVAEDITELKEIQQSLLKERNLLRTLIDSLPDYIYIKDTESRFIATNVSNIQVLSAASLEEVVGKSDFDFYSHELAERFYADERQIIRSGQAIINREEEVIDPAGRKLLVLTSKVPFRDNNGTITGIVGIGRDITDQKDLEQQLQQAQKMESIGRLAGGVAHDFNNMLSVILIHAEMVLSRMGPSEPLRDNLQEILRAGKRSEEIARQLLAFARKQIISPRVLDLNETVEGMLKILRRLIGEDIDLSWMPRSDLWRVKIDPAQIDQIMANFCVNARDAIIGVGKITIETDNVVFDETYCANHVGCIPGEFALLAVSDDGCGMDKETMDKIFDPFFTTKETGKGTGLGLSIVYGIVEQNNGFINVYSEPDFGTTFKIYIPRYAGKDVEEKKAETEPAPRGRGETVLVVEDEDSILQLAETVLDDFGYRVLTAKTPAEALVLAGKHTGDISLLVTDVVMSEMNGRDLAERLLPICPNIKTLYMSGYTANVIAHRGVLAEGINFIQKPFSINNLASKVHEVLDSTGT